MEDMEQDPPDLHRAPLAHGAGSGPKDGPQPALLHELHASATDTLAPPEAHVLRALVAPDALGCPYPFA